MFHSITSTRGDPSVRLSRGSMAEPVCRQIAVCVASDFRYDLAVLMASTRGSPPQALARQIAMYLAHVGFGLSFEAIGRVFGRDRTTVSHACRVIEDRRDDAALDRRLAALEADCRETIGGGR